MKVAETHREGFASVLHLPLSVLGGFFGRVKEKAVKSGEKRRFGVNVY